ncbi:MAG TPA: hypothetical protein VL361_05355 [Candidatus Limnocylindrales bacterium]|jgi:hypothetical protein|nr:hypothetical protein [Candidatus Limnocylindrales bacterium]
MNPNSVDFKWRSVPCVFAYSIIFAGMSAVAQPALIPDNPALPPSSISRAITPSNPAMAGPALPSSPTAATNFSVAGLSQLLAELQVRIQQVLPVLNSFNNSFDFISVGSNTNAAGLSGTEANFSSSLGANSAAHESVQLSTSVAVSTLNSGSASSLNAFGLPPGLGVAPVTSETLRSLLVLENDIERMLPTLNALNGGTNALTGIGLTPGFAPGAVSNVFMVPSTVR